MKKSDLIARLAPRFPDLVLADVHAAVDQILRAMTSALASGHRIEIRDFGSYAVTRRPPRQGRNPKTGQRVHVSAKHAVHFKAGKLMKLLVDGRTSD